MPLLPSSRAAQVASASVASAVVVATPVMTTSGSSCIKSPVQCVGHGTAPTSAWSQNTEWHNAAPHPGVGTANTTPSSATRLVAPAIRLHSLPEGYPSPPGPPPVGGAGDFSTGGGLALGPLLTVSLGPL